MKIEDANNIYIGSTQASKVCLGSSQIWPVLPNRCNISGRLSSYARSFGLTSINLVFNFPDGGGPSAWANREVMTVPVDNDGYFNVTTFGPNITVPITTTVEMFGDNIIDTSIGGNTSDASYLLESFSFYADTSHVIDFSVNYQVNLTSLNVANLNLSSVEHVTFYNLAVTSLDLSSWIIDPYTLRGISFMGCSDLTNIVWPNFYSPLGDLPELQSIDYCYENCSSLTTLDLRIFNLSQISSLLYCFNNCTSLTTLYLPEIPNNISSPWNQGCFRNCSSLINVYVTHQSTLNCITNNLTSQGDSYVPSSAAIHYNNDTYMWNGSSWALQS